MTTWAIGDIQGCFTALKKLLRVIDFSPARDRLILLGDLVNRGPESLEVLRWARSCDAVEAVLGNHDLHLLAAAAGVSQLSVSDELHTVLNAPDREALLSWLRHRPLLLLKQNYVCVHAALHPQWSLAEAQRRARAAQDALCGPGWADLLAAYYEVDVAPSTVQQPEHQRSGLHELLCSLAVFTRLRCLTEDGELSFDYTGPLDGLPPGRVPWWRAVGASWPDWTVLFGHWAAVGLHQESGILALDTGCVWGRQLSAYCLEDRRIEQVDGWRP